MQILTSPQKALVDLLQISPKTFPAYGVKVIVAFVLSGALHAATLPRNLANASPLRYASFFWIHGVCVLIEAILERTIERNISKKSSTFWTRSCVTIARLVWTLGILYYTAPVIADELTNLTRRSKMFGLRPVLLLSLSK